MQRQVWRTARAGNIARLQQRTETLPPLADDQVRVQVSAVGLNFADIFALTGLYSATPKGSFIPGLEFAGTVLASGSRSGRWQPGDQVLGVTRFGGYASVIDSAPGALYALPEGWEPAQGAAWPAQTLTAWYALRELGNLQPDQQVLIHSAAGGVGLQAMQLARALGASPVGTVGHSDKLALLQTLGFESLLVRERDFGAQLQAAGLSFDLVLDAIGGRVQRDSFAALRPMGRLVVFGAAEFTPTRQRPDYLRALWRYLRRPRYDIMAMISDNRSVMAFNLIWLWDQIERLAPMLDTVQKMQIPPPHVGHRFPFADAPAALDCLKSGRSEGKVVLLLEQP